MEKGQERLEYAHLGSALKGHQPAESFGGRSKIGRDLDGHLPCPRALHRRLQQDSALTAAASLDVFLPRASR
jgi:hypothetical protein